MNDSDDLVKKKTNKNKTQKCLQKQYIKKNKYI